MPDRSDANPHRLPRSVVPASYDLHLHPDIDAASFSGTVRIDVEVRETTTEIVCNAADLVVDEAWLERDGNRTTLDARLDEEAERLVLVPDHPVDPGTATLHVVFRGELNDKLRGFYRSTYHDDDGVERHLATTQFEATDARRAFPCWDEPDAKATFTIALTIDESLTAISNSAQVARTDLGDGTVEVRFAPTMVMSTYLVAFVIGDLEATAPVDVRGTPLRVVHVPGKGELAAFALEVGAFALEFFEDWYGIAYPGDELDLVAIPDFAFGAMENLGCVTFREVLLLVDPERATQGELQNVVDVISHELAHMWFGDLVTMRWWEGIWLNEAFATFMEVLATDAFRPAWERWVAFGLSRSAAFDVDALDATRPIEFEVRSPAEAEGMFDLLTYEKGCSVVRMLQQYLGEDAFRDGIQRYLRTHQHDNTETADLWDALEASSGEPVRRVADTWILQGGYPLLRAERAGDGVRVRQQRFRYTGGDDGRRWGVPVLWRASVAGEQREGRLLLEDDAADLPIGGAPDWVVLNAGGHGFVRSTYDPDLRRGVLDAATSGELSAIERFALVDDSWATVVAGETAAIEHLELVEALARSERDLSVWQRTIATLGALDGLVDGAARAALAERVVALLEPVADSLGADARPDDDARSRQLRGAVLGALALLGRAPVAIERARAIDAAVAAGGDEDPALAAAALGVVGALADAEMHEQLRARGRDATTPQDELRLLHALVAVEDPALLEAFLPRCLTDEVRTQNAPYVLRQAMHSREGGTAAWSFVRSRWDEIGERFPSNSIARMLEGVRSLDDAEVADDVAAFIAAHPVPQGAQIVAQHLERQRVNVALRAREAARVADALLTP